MDPLQSQVRIGKDVFIAPTAYVGGEVCLGNACTVMHQVTIRGDVADDGRAEWQKNAGFRGRGKSWRGLGLA